MQIWQWRVEKTLRFGNGGDSAEIDGKDDVYVNAYFNAVKNRKQSHFVAVTFPDIPVAHL